MTQEQSKHPIADMGEDFQPDAMHDFDDRMKSGEFAKLTIEQIREVYVNEEADAVDEQDHADMCQRINDMEEAEFQRSLGE